MTATQDEIDADANILVDYTEKTSTAAGHIKAVKVRNVVIKSQKTNNWSGAAGELPFFDVLPTGGNHGDAGQNGYVTVTFNYNDAGDAIIGVTLSSAYQDALSGDTSSNFDPA